MQLHCAMKPSPLALPTCTGLACEPWLRGSDLHLTNRERVGRYSSYTVDDRSSKLTRAKSAVGGSVHTESGFYRQQMSPHDPTPYPLPSSVNRF